MPECKWRRKRRENYWCQNGVQELSTLEERHCMFQKVTNQNAAPSHVPEKNRNLNWQVTWTNGPITVREFTRRCRSAETQGYRLSEAAEARVWKTMTRRDKSSYRSWFLPKLRIVLVQEVHALAPGMVQTSWTRQKRIHGQSWGQRAFVSTFDSFTTLISWSPARGHWTL